MDDHNIYRDLAEKAYEKNDNPIHGYTKDFDLSNDNHIVYKKDNNVVISYRGTANVNDIYTDYLFGKGEENNSKRFKESEDVALKVKNKYINSKITTTGHSLGGAISININKKFGYDAIVFNPAGNLNTVFEKQNNVKVYRNKTDLVSLPYVFKKNTTTFNKNLNPFEAHKIKNLF